MRKMKLGVVISLLCCFTVGLSSEGSKDTKVNAEYVATRGPTASAFNTPKQSEVKKDRAALFSQPRIFPFLDQLFNPLAHPLARPDALLPPSVLRPVPIGGGSLGYGDDIFYSAIKPECAQNGHYCLYNAAYPSDKVNSIVDRYYEDVRELHSSLHRVPISDLVYFDNKTHGYRDNGHFVCESQVQYIRPGWARSVRGQWLAIINTQSFPQNVRVEECKYADRRCEYLPPCYKSTCIQRYSYEKLLSVDPLDLSKKPFIEIFEIPTACSCFVENFLIY